MDLWPPGTVHLWRLVVEHESEAIAIADHVVDLGPGAGAAGGTVVYQGSVTGLRQSATITGRHLGRRQPLKRESRRPTGHLLIEHARLHNLRDVTVQIPPGCAQRRDRRGRVGQELADPRPSGPSQRRGDGPRPGPDPRLASL